MAFLLVLHEVPLNIKQTKLCRPIYICVSVPAGQFEARAARRSTREKKGCYRFYSRTQHMWLTEACCMERY